jgi:hypothetical protein
MIQDIKSRMILDIKVGDRLYVINDRGKFLRTIGWVGENMFEWKWGWADRMQVDINPDTKSRVKYMVVQK